MSGYRYTAAEILRRGFELSLRFPGCPLEVQASLHHAAEVARVAEVMARAEPEPTREPNTWDGEPLFQ